MDKMYISGLTISCIIGTKPIERKRKQKIVIDVVLECDMRKAGKTDNLKDTVNYKTLSEKIVLNVSNSNYFLIETLADSISKICLSDPGVKGVTVKVEKPGALKMARSASVEIYRGCGRK